MMENPFSLEGKTIMVTGASSGIGQATAIECSKMGASVIALGRDKDRLNTTLESMAGKNSIMVCDILKEDDLTNLISNIPLLDGVVLCAGIGETLLLQFATKKKIDRVFNTNFFANVELIRLLLKNKKIKNGGSIVTLASIGGIHNFTIGNGIYGAAKAALDSWMKNLAIELATKPIRVNTICPGMVKTPFINLSKISEEQLNLDRQKYPMKRYGLPEEVAYAIIYLLSDASSWVTGSSLIIDGGRSLV